MKFTNTKAIPPLVAGWLTVDEYDYNKDAKTISATSLLKPLKQLILAERYRVSKNATVDVSNLIRSRLGTAVHDSIEKSWLAHLPQILENLSIPKIKREQIEINPEKPHKNAIYLEQRGYLKLPNGWTVSGKFDAVFFGTVTDIKFTSTYTYETQNKAEDYAIQGSIYRAIHPSIITNDVIDINYIFSDWKEANTYKPNYPKAASVSANYPLYEVDDTVAWMEERIELIEKYINEPEENIPECSKEDLWIANSTFKYYKNPAAHAEGKRSTNNFETFDEALAKKVSDGNVGLIVEVPDPPKACKHCDALPICKQGLGYVNSGLITLGD